MSTFPLSSTPLVGVCDEILGKSTTGGEDDVDINTSDTTTLHKNQISGLITRARAHQLNSQVSSFLASYSSYLDNTNVYSILLLRNDRQE
jgi:hypothetical protein